MSNQSTGLTNPIKFFGHQIAFSSPYPQMDWDTRRTLDRVVIYNISSSGITTGGWENTGAGGHWMSDFIHTWNTSTTFNPDAENWYAFPVFLQDNETQLTDMKVLSPNITLQLVGTTPMELFFDSQMESPNGSSTENILGFGNDQSGAVQWTNPGMHVKGPIRLMFPEKYPDNTSIQEDGRSGQPYQSFPMGTIAAAIPGQTYEFTMIARCTSGVGRINLSVSCSDWGTRSQYSVLAGSYSPVFSHPLGLCYETIHGTYTVPYNQNAWFLQGTVEFLDSTGYDVSLFSVKRQHTSNTTDEFHLYLSGHWYNSTGSLVENEPMNFSVAPWELCDHDGVMHFTASIQGNHYGMVNLVYREPILLGMNARFRVNTQNDSVYNLSLTKTISRVSAEKMMLWSSMVFQKFPYATEFLFRLLMHGTIGRVLSSILERMHPGISSTFKMFPFSTNPLYTQMKITATDASGMIHHSTSGNIWFSCAGPDLTEKIITVTFPKR